MSEKDLIYIEELGIYLENNKKNKKLIADRIKRVYNFKTSTTALLFLVLFLLIYSIINTNALTLFLSLIALMSIVGYDYQKSFN